MLAFVLVTAVPGAEDFRRLGYDVHWWQFVTMGLVDVGIFLLLARPVWWVLDHLPFSPGQRWRSASGRLLCALAYAVVDGAITLQLMRLTVHVYGIDPQILGEQDAQLPSLVREGLFGFVVLMIAHTILLRSHERQELLMVERSLAQARLQALSLELQPHFLFNTLNGIVALVRDDPVRAEQMLVRLSDLLRVTLAMGMNGHIPLHRELANLDLYLDLQGMRFGQRLTVVRNIQPEALGARVPPMLLQPLVENALTHGIALQSGPGRLELAARREGDTLALRVYDDGAGLPPQGARRERTGVGTTRARLATMFGDGHSLTLSPAPGGGTVAEVRIPFVPAEEA